ncbi:MAG: hypothetical protein AAF791_01300 [Bacteroidota bacterium]
MLRLVLPALVLLAFAPASVAQSSSLGGVTRATDLVDWTARIVPGDTAGEAHYVLDVTVAEGWNLYGSQSQAGVPLTVSFSRLPEGVVPRGGLRESPTVNGMDEALGLPYAYHIESGQVTQRLRVDRRAEGRHRIRAAVRFTVCNDSVCLPPTTVETAATLAVGG